MTPKQYADAIERLGLSQRGAGKFLGVDEHTSREQQISQRAREIRYGEGCSIEQARRWATEEFDEWDRVHSPLPASRGND